MPLWKQMGIGDVIHQDFPCYAELPDQDEGSFYEKCLKATGICYIAGVLLDQGEYRSAFLGVHRSANEPVFQQEELDFLKRIGVHIRRALQIHKQLSFARIENRNLYKMLDTIKVGIILIDEIDLRIAYKTQPNTLQFGIRLNISESISLTYLMDKNSNLGFSNFISLGFEL